MVLTVQGGGQIILPQNFQGGSINLKSLQGLKVIPIQQQNKGKFIVLSLTEWIRNLTNVKIR